MCALKSRITESNARKCPIVLIEKMKLRNNSLVSPEELIFKKKNNTRKRSSKSSQPKTVTLNSNNNIISKDFENTKMLSFNNENRSGLLNVENAKIRLIKEVNPQVSKVNRRSQRNKENCILLENRKTTRNIDKKSTVFESKIDHPDEPLKMKKILSRRPTKKTQSETAILKSNSNLTVSKTLNSLERIHNESNNKSKPVLGDITSQIQNKSLSLNNSNSIISKGIECLKRINDSNQNIKLVPEDVNVKKNIQPQSPKNSSLVPKKQVNNRGQSNKENYRLLENRKSPQNIEEKLAVYDFTFDPAEEPLKKKKKVVRKRPTKKTQPKTFLSKTNYNTSISKTLKNLKKAINESNIKSKRVNKSDITSLNIKSNNVGTKEEVPKRRKENTVVKDKIVEAKENTVVDNLNNEVPMEIVTDAEINAIDDIDYSPVASPNKIPQHHPKPSIVNETRDLLYNRARSTVKPDSNQDPLNLFDVSSFFDDQPVANSSMNTSNIKHPMASPWRPNFNSLPLKWSVNAYVKPNMTPAIETSFIEDNEHKKHVYTNIVPPSEVSLPDIVTNDIETTELRQPSILSFINSSPNKEKDKIHETPIQETAAENYDDESVHLFEDIELIHHLKPARKSYSKCRKKVTFCQENNANSDSDSENREKNNCFSDDDDPADVSFQMPSIKVKATKKKRKPKSNQLTKKEQEEVDAWAAAFNSMCEDVDEFPLVLE